MYVGRATLMVFVIAVCHIMKDMRRPFAVGFLGQVKVGWTAWRDGPAATAEEKSYAPRKNLPRPQTKQVQLTRFGEEEIEDRLRLEQRARRAHAQAKSGGGKEADGCVLGLKFLGSSRPSWKDFGRSFDRGRRRPAASCQAVTAWPVRPGSDGKQRRLSLFLYSFFPPSSRADDKSRLQ